MKKKKKHSSSSLPLSTNNQERKEETQQLLVVKPTTCNTNKRFILLLVILLINCFVAFVTKHVIVSLYYYNYSRGEQATTTVKQQQQHRKIMAEEGNCCDCPTLYTCPTSGSSGISSIEIGTGGGLFKLAVSSNNILCTLTIVETITTTMDGSSSYNFKPVARSYSGNDWEASAGDYSNLDFSCHQEEEEEEGVCIVNLQDIQSERGGLIVQYQLTSYNDNAPETLKFANVASRFLEQATFGPTMTDIANLQLEQQQQQQSSSSSLSASSTRVFANWVQNQIRLPPSSHRELFRKHANARFEFASPIGKVTHPCRAGTRYRKFAFSSKDYEKTITIASIVVVVANNNNNQKKSLAVNDNIRTIVDGPVMGMTKGGTAVTFPDGRYLICRLPPENSIGGTVLLQHPTLGCMPVRFSRTLTGNPPVNFPAGTTTTTTTTSVLESSLVITIQQDEASPIGVVHDSSSGVTTTADDDEVVIQELIVNKDLNDPSCESVNDLVYPVTTTVFGLTTDDGDYWIHDARFEFVENTLTHPIPDGGGSIVQEAKSTVQPEANPVCANVRRNFLNEDHCQLSSSPDTCVPYGSQREDNNDTNDDNDNNDTSLFVPIDHDFMRLMYEDSEETLYLYAINDLRIQDDPVTAPPCQKGSTSRWVPLDECSSSTNNNNVLGQRTERLFARMISYYANNNDNNPNVLDTTYPNNVNAECDEQDQLKKGFEVADLQGNCWLNVHPDHWNVYDFTVWTKLSTNGGGGHPGNSAARNPIQEFAESGLTFLDFPSWHEMDRWQDNKRKFIPLLGRLGDFINFDEVLGQLIPGSSSITQNNTTSDAAAAADDDFSLRLVCGSPYEVSNDADATTLGGAPPQGRRRRGVAEFDVATPAFVTTSTNDFHQQKKMIWTELALKAPDQLRQRIAWALSQLLVVSTSAITKGYESTEMFTVYYDIFVRHAFGNYKDVLKEVSYNSLMAEMLTYYQSKSTASVYEQKGNIEYADENYAREIMQLFTNGLYVLDEKGNNNNNQILVYDNDDIEEYARAWTGFENQPFRGNIEPYYITNSRTSNNNNRIDPMNINVKYRDVFPKMGLNRNYIGDGVPLCEDLPQQHFLQKGAVYRLLGKSPTPELHNDPIEWSTNPEYQPLSLFSQPNNDNNNNNGNNSLFSKLCGTAHGSSSSSSNTNNCEFRPKVVLDESISCNNNDNDNELLLCSVDTIRTVQVVDGIFYEYIPPPCVHFAFFNDAKTVVQPTTTTEQNTNTNTNTKQYVRMMIANPNTASAGIACCTNSDDENETNDETSRNEPYYYYYWGERTLYSTAQERCRSGQEASSSKSLCSSSSSSRPICNNQEDEKDASCYDTNGSNQYYWTDIPCTLRVKINSNNGKIAIVHEIHTTNNDDNYVEIAKHVQEDSPTYFRVDWMTTTNDGDNDDDNDDNDYYTTITSNCDSYTHCNTAASASSSDGVSSCVCDVLSVSNNEQVYFDEDDVHNNLKAEDILQKLTIGAFMDPSSSNDMVRTESTTAEGVSWYSSSTTTNNDVRSLSSSTVFRVVDPNTGIVHFRKNSLSKVTVLVGTDNTNTNSTISFRNPVHFVSLVDPEPRDAHYETDETLNHYFHHKTTAPFLAKRFAQRFGISNPSPRYIQTIATSFRTGSYQTVDDDDDDGDDDSISFGSNEYGDLAATFAAILLDREARDVVLDSDPTQGGLKEPLIKLIGLMRSMEYQQYDNDYNEFIEFSSSIGAAIGQMAHEIPTVFSFFLPDYQPSGGGGGSGVLSKAFGGGLSLVSPEAQVISGPTIVGSLNGFYSLIKYGLGSCFGGLGGNSIRGNTNNNDNCRIGMNLQQNAGNLTFLPSSRTPTKVVDELATLLTAGRLSAESRLAVRQIFSQQADNNPYLGYLSVQQAIVSSPEFHSTNRVRLSGERRPDPPNPTPPSNPYKALVYVLLSGGMDSYNLLVPHTCSETNPSGQTVLEQYYEQRTSIAIGIGDDERSRIIDASSSGQPCSEFVVHEDLSTVESLYKAGDLAFFANMGVLNAPVTKDNYNIVTETQLFAHNTMQLEAQRIDPYSSGDGGVLGRMVDVLLAKGYAAKPITVDSASLATVGVPGNGTDPLFVSSRGAFEFNPGQKQRGEFDIGPFITELNEATETMHSGLFGETWSSRLQLALRDNEELVDVLSDSTELTQPFDGGSYSSELKTVASLIVAHERRGTDRDIFFVDLGGWDHHNNMKTELADHFQSLDIALSDFTLEMKEQNLWNDVTLVIVSDFARTLTANSGEGSDHAWAGNYFLTGGSVSGGQIHGRYPSDITESGPYNIGRGRLIPDLSWESMLNSVAMHMGIETNDELNYCMPNRVKAGAKLFTEAEVFDVSK